MNEKVRFIRSFVLGFVLGGSAVYTGIHFCRHHGMRGAPWESRGGFHSKKMLEKMSEELDLTPEQKVLVEKILAANLPKFKELKESVRPKFSAVRSALQAEIRAVLKPEQQAKFDKLVGEFENRRKMWEEKRNSEK